jgi:hypothetical protein
LGAHGFYKRTLVDIAVDGTIRRLAQTLGQVCDLGP